MKNVVLTGKQMVDIECMAAEVLEQKSGSGRDRHDVELFYMGVASGISVALGVSYNDALGAVRCADECCILP